MANMIDYVKQNNQTFADAEFNEVDGLVLSELSYIRWEELLTLTDEKLGGSGYTKQEIERLLKYGGNEGLPLHKAVELLQQTAYWKDKKVSANGKSMTLNEESLLETLATSERFKNIIIGNFEEKFLKKPDGETGSVDNIEQFSAMTFIFEDGSGKPQVFFAFRGTDNTLEGWNEDFLMGFEPQTQAQKSAVEYLNRVAKLVDGDIRMGGHSKGGNHSNYAFLFCEEEIRERVVKLYSYDGPGFHDKLAYEGIPVSEENLKKMYELLGGTAVAPYDTVIGALLEDNEFIYVDTDAGMVADHDPFTWQIEDGSFCERERSAESKYIDELLDKFLFSMPDELRKNFLNAVWDWIYSLNEKYFEDVGKKFGEYPLRTIMSLIAFVAYLPEDEREDFLEVLGNLFITAVDEELISQYGPEIAESFVEFLSNKIDEWAEDSDYWYNYKIIKDKVIEILHDKNIESWEEFLVYIQQNPVEHIMDFVSELLQDFETVKAIATVRFSLRVVSYVLAAVLSSLLKIVIPILSTITILLTVFSILKSISDFLKGCWDKLMELKDQAIEYAKEKITEFVEALRLRIVEDINSHVVIIFQKAEELLQSVGRFTDAISDVVTQMRNLMSASIRAMMKITNPLLYGIIRTVSGIQQQMVTVDMRRLENAVEQMERLANRVERVDIRLDNLYRQISINNIAQGEGIFTSLANLYNLLSADIKVDEGNKIRRKAIAIRETFSDYEETERWVLNQLGG